MMHRLEQWTENLIARLAHRSTTKCKANGVPPSGVGRIASGSEKGAVFDIPASCRMKHLYLLGATGSGKTNLLRQLIASDIKDGKSTVVLDMRGDLVDRILQAHADDLDAESTFLIDLRCPSVSWGINPFRTSAEPYGAAMHIHFVLKSLAVSWGVQLDETLRNSLVALSFAQRNLCELPHFLREEAFRSEVLRSVCDPDVRAFFASFAGLSADRRAAWTAPVLNKVSPLLSHPAIRAILSERVPIDLGTVLQREGSVVLIALAADRLHGLASAIGCLIVSAIENAMMARVDIAEEQRTPVHLYLDEFENFQSPAFESIIAEGRRFRVGLTLSHQNLHQLDSKLRHVVTNNAATRIYFRTGHSDAKELSAELDAFGISGAAQRLLRLPVGEAFIIDSTACAHHVSFREAARRTSKRSVSSLIQALANRSMPTIHGQRPYQAMALRHLRRPRALLKEGETHAD